MQIHPLNNRVFVRPAPAPEWIGSIAVPVDFRPNECKGTVVRASPSAVVEDGQEIVYERPPKGLGYDTALVDGEELLVMGDQHVLAVLEE
jgi:co-chaperonin GroES (HSP10)